MKACIVDNHSRFLAHIFGRLHKQDIPYALVDVTEVTPDTEKAFDFFILSGGSLDLADPLFDAEKKLVRTTKKPVFGICCGFQLIAVAYGSQLVALPEGVVKVDPVRVMNLDRLGIGYREPVLPVQEHHHFAIKECPAGFSVYAESDHGLEMIVHDSLPIWATQFHPEVTEGNRGHLILDRFLTAVLAA